MEEQPQPIDGLANQIPQVENKLHGQKERQQIEAGSIMLDQ